MSSSADPGSPRTGRVGSTACTAAITAPAWTSWFDGGVVQRAMRFDVPDLGAGDPGQRLQRTDLVDDVGRQLLGRESMNRRPKPARSR